MSQINKKQPSILAETWNYWKNHKVTPICLGIICAFQFITFGLLGILPVLIILCVWFAGFADGHIAEIEHEIEKIEAKISEYEKLVPKTRIN